MSNRAFFSRRDFIKAVSAAAGALILAPLPLIGAGRLGAAGSRSVMVEALGKQYLGTAAGLVFESIDGGQSWQRVANFGQHCAVVVLRERQNQLYAEIGLMDHRFALKSKDARAWRTA
jgi:hypothetical protein